MEDCTELLTFITEEKDLHEDCLIRAIKVGNLSVLRILLTDPNGYNDDMITFLSIAVKARQFEIAKFLLQKGADPNYVHVEHTLPLWIAIRKNDALMTELLLHNGADLDYEFFNSSYLYEAIKAQAWDVIPLLVNKKHNESDKWLLDLAIENNAPNDIIRLIVTTFSSDLMLQDSDYKVFINFLFCA